MKLRGDINPEAQQRLHKNFLPALERMAKTATFLFQPDQVMVIQKDEDGTEGCFVKLELPSEFIFSNFIIQANKENTIAFSIHVALLIKVFSTANSMLAEHVQMLLTTIPVSGGDSRKGEVTRQPALRFICKGLEHSSVQEVPLVGKPLNSKQIDEIMDFLQHMTLHEWYLSIGSHVPQVQSMLQIVAKDVPFVHILTSRGGELHMQVESEYKVQGMEVRTLEIFPPEKGGGSQQAGSTSDERFSGLCALDADKCPRAEVQTKSLTHALSAAYHTTSELLLLSCGDSNRPIVHVLCAFVGEQGVLQDYAFNVWLPGRDPDQ